MNAITIPTPATIGFDYSLLDTDVADEARATAERIRRRQSTAITMVGHELIRIKAKMEHGTFGKWIAAALDMTPRSAENYMNAARWMEGKNETVSLLPPTLVYALASPSAPEAVVNEVLANVEAGTKLATKDVKEKIATAIEAERKAAIEVKKTSEQRAKEKKASESRQQREARRQAEDQREKEKQEREEQARVDRLQPLVWRIVAAIEPRDLAALNRVFADGFGADWQSQQTFKHLFRAAAAEALA